MEKKGINWSNAIQETQQQIQSLRSGGMSNVIDNKRIRMVAITQIFPDPNQPRKNIDVNSEEIKELADSIKEHGFINFITVAEKENGYKIITGERRFIAAKVTGLEEIPVMVIGKEMEPLEMALFQLEENLQRKDLTSIEEAEAYERLHKELGVKQVEIATMVKKNKGYVSKMMSIANISPKIKEDIRKTNQAISKEVLISLSTYPEVEQLAIWEKVREKPTEAALKTATKKAKSKRKKQEELDANEVFNALNKVLKIKGIEYLFHYISPQKAKKLFREAEMAENKNE